MIQVLGLRDNKMPIKPTGKAAGNAHITIPDSSGGNYFDADVWIMSFQTAVTTQFENDQVHRGVSWFPIRRSEQFVNFSIAWPYKSSMGAGGFQSMQAFQDCIRLHQQESVLTGAVPKYIKFTYYNNTNTRNKSQAIDQNLSIHHSKAPALQPITYNGWIDTVSKEYTRAKAIYVVNYRMNIINVASQISQSVPNTSAGTMTPTSYAVKAQGLNWIKTNTTIGDGIDLSKILGASK